MVKQQRNKGKAFADYVPWSTKEKFVATCHDSIGVILQRKGFHELNSSEEIFKDGKRSYTSKKWNPSRLEDCPWLQESWLADRIIREWRLPNFNHSCRWCTIRDPWLNDEGCIDREHYTSLEWKKQESCDWEAGRDKQGVLNENKEWVKFPSKSRTSPRPKLSGKYLEGLHWPTLAMLFQLWWQHLQKNQPKSSRLHCLKVRQKSKKSLI